MFVNLFLGTLFRWTPDRKTLLIALMSNILSRITFALPDDTLAEVDALAKRFGVSRSRVVTQFVRLSLHQPSQTQRDALLNLFPSPKEFSDA
jgi:hypothetical protein